MAKRKKRAPPSYSEKYRQIKKSGFNVDIPKPTTPASKSLVTRYHRILFGGNRIVDGKREHTFGLVKSYVPVKSKSKAVNDAINHLYRTPRTKRIKGSYIPSEFESVQSVNKTTIKFKTKQGIYSVLRLSPKEIQRAIEEDNLDSVLKPLKDNERIQLIFGAHMQPHYRDVDSTIDELIRISKFYKEGGQNPLLDVLTIGSFEFN